MKQMPRSARVATHLPLLVRVFDKSEGDVLEIGTGYFSTLVLKWLCTITGRKLYSYETKEFWYKRAVEKNNEFHEVVYAPDLDKVDFTNKHWGLVLIDHGPNRRRVVEIEKLANHCDYMVIHDTQPCAKDKDLPADYHYEKIWHLFKYRYDYKKILPWTSVVSNFKKLNDIK
jgi:hypothetical protein